MIYIFSPEYEKPDLKGHIFPLAKYRLIKESLIKSRKAVEEDFKAPIKPSMKDIQLVHDSAYLGFLVLQREVHMPHAVELVVRYLPLNPYV